MKIKLTLLSVAVLGVALFSCKKGGEQQVVSQLNLSTSVEQSQAVAGDLTGKSYSSFMSKVSSTKGFETGDKIGVYLAEWQGATADAQTADTLVASGNQTDNHLFTYTATPSWTTLALTNPLTWRKTSLFAYHPYNATLANALAVPYETRADQSAGQQSEDYLMWGVGVNNAVGHNPITEAPIGMNFTHKLAHLKVKVTLPATYNGATITSITSASVIGFPKSATLNLQKGLLTPHATDKGTVKMYKTGMGLTVEFDAVVIPGSIAAGAELIKIQYEGTPSNGSFIYNVPADGFKLSENQIYTLTLSTEEFGFPTDLGDIAPTETVKDVSVTSTKADLAWTMTSGDISWIKLSTDGITYVDALNVTGPATVKVKILANPNLDPRMSKVVLKAAGYPDRELVVRQLRKI